MPKKNNNLRSVIIQGSSSENDHTSLSDLKKLMTKQFADVMSKFQELNGRVMNVEDGMGRLLIASKSNEIEIKARSTGPRCLKLVFRNKISHPVRNGEEIKGEGGKHIEVALVDDVTGTVVDFGPEASAHVGIVSLEGDSDHCEGDTWVIGNYKNKSVGESEEKKSILVGQVKVKLNKGIGSLVNVKFRNSSNHNSGVFKLGAKVIDSFDGTLIKEAMTEPFVVKDFREKYKEKHYPPSLSDDIWRLENIQKTGGIYKRVKEKVKTVEDFLIQLLKDHAGLKRSFGLQEKKWEATVNHAQTCKINQKVYCSINSQEKKGVVFNVVGKTLGLIKDLKYVQHDMLSEEDKVEARRLLSIAFRKEVKDFDNEDSLLQYLSTANTVSHGVETSKIGESGQLNLDASSQDASTSKHPDRGIIVSHEPEATGLDRVNLQDVFPTDKPRACSGLEAPLQGSIPINQANNINADDMNLIAPSQERFGSKHPGGGIVSQEAEASVLINGLDFQAIFPSISPTGGSGLEGPLFSPFDFEDAFLPLSPSKVEVEASESHGCDLRDMDMETDCFLNSQENYCPLWNDSIDHDQYHHDIPSSSPLIDNSNWLTQFHARPSYSKSYPRTKKAKHVNG